MKVHGFVVTVKSDFIDPHSEINQIFMSRKGSSKAKGKAPAAPWIGLFYRSVPFAFLRERTGALRVTYASAVRV